MRIWHKELIEYLPRMQLLGQWRECCCIAKNIALYGTPNHILVNKVMNFPLTHFRSYCEAVAKEMERRGYLANFTRLDRWLGRGPKVDRDEWFDGWHDDRYLRQCLYNLEEKAMCGGVPVEEWKRITDEFGKEFTLWSGKE